MQATEEVEQVDQAQIKKNLETESTNLVNEMAQEGQEDSLLFKPVPLINLLNAEQDSVLKLVERQSQVMKDRVAEAGNDRPPEIRFKGVSS